MQQRSVLLRPVQLQAMLRQISAISMLLLLLAAAARRLRAASQGGGSPMLEQATPWMAKNGLRLQVLQSQAQPRISTTGGDRHSWAAEEASSSYFWEEEGI